ncbi:MAG: response regulator [Chloroflexota bacterium]|nr:MAG: response regulator [Chloroflexota bacterium]
MKLQDPQDNSPASRPISSRLPQGEQATPVGVWRSDVPESPQYDASSGSKIDLDTLLDDILVQIGQVVPYDSACIFLVEEGSLLGVAARDLPDSAQVIGRSFPLDDELTRQVLIGRQPVVLEDARRLSAFKGWGGTATTQGWMGVPLIAQDTGIGYLTLDSRHKGAYGPAEAKLALAFANQAAMTIENARLIDETQALLEQTQQQASQLGQLMNIIPDGIVLLDEGRRVVEANEAARAYLAQLADVQIGQKLAQLGNEPLTKLLEPRAIDPSWHELTAVEPTGVFEVSAQPIGQPEQPDGWLLLIRNVTAARKQEGYLRVQERLSTVGQLAAGIAHDFNNIMAIISLYTQLVMRSSGLSDIDGQRLGIIQQQAQRASDLIRQILDFSRQSVVEKKPLDLLPFVGEAVRALRQGLPVTVQLETRFEDDEYFAQADSGRLLQALNNLAVNAVDAMPNGGRLFFALEHLRLSAGEPFPLPDMTSGDWIRLTVSDTGRGIPPESLSRIFEPFYTTKPTNQGTGLGLAQVYGIVKLHDGFIDVNSQLGQGTTFTLYLPAFAPPAQQPVPPKDDQSYFGSGESILIVEDDRATREALAEYLSALNYRVLTGANGRQALEIFQESGDDVQLVLTDMIMPVMDGATLYGELKRRGAEIKMVVITGYPLDANLVGLLEREAISFLQKPLRVEEVARTIRETLSKRP